MFGTAIKGKSGFPEKYGVKGDYMPDGFARQWLLPFHKQK
ncbi:sterol desaturase/sphingolipid hydroxylase (fatty acid hydroxylase superfamily) [Oxalobacteraceae bacterium GrIS 1.11]